MLYLNKVYTTEFSGVENLRLPRALSRYPVHCKIILCVFQEELLGCCQLLACDMFESLLFIPEVGVLDVSEQRQCRTEGGFKPPPPEIPKISVEFTNA